MNLVWLYSLVSVFIISLIPLLGLLTFKIKIEKLNRILIYLVSFSAVALLGDAFIHLLPEAVKEHGFSLFLSLSVLVGILLFFILEKVVYWQHCHMPITKQHVHPFVYMNLVGDALHNFIDGLIIAASYIISLPIGIATTIAVFIHEIPQEIGDFGIMLHGGFSRGRAVFYHFLIGLAAVFGTILGLLFEKISSIQNFLLPLAIGGFVYIAGSDLIPELHKETKIAISIRQIISFVLGILVMLDLLILG